RYDLTSTTTSPTSLSSFFFFQCSRPHRHLHSFPTRRSSDLCLRAPGAANTAPTSSSAIATARPALPVSSRQPTGFSPTAVSRSRDRKSTRLNSSHLVISYAVFCLKKKNLLEIRHSMLVIVFY